MSTSDQRPSNIDTLIISGYLLCKHGISEYRKQKRKKAGTLDDDSDSDEDIAYAPCKQDEDESNDSSYDTDTALVLHPNPTFQFDCPECPLGRAPDTHSDNCTMNAILACPGCERTSGIPKLLPCQHSLCVKCISTMATKNALGGVILCPKCESEAILPEGGSKNLKTDSRLMRMRNYFIAKKNKTMCEKKDKRQATKCCSDCKIDLCASCAEKHTSHTLFSTHTLMPLSVVMCDGHDKFLEYFCERCVKLLCVVCIGESCTDHNDISKLSEIESMKLEEMDRVIEIIQARIKYCNITHRPKQNQIEQLLGLLQGQEDNIGDHVDKLIQQTMARKRHLLGQVAEARAVLMDTNGRLQMGDQHEELNQLLSVAKEVRQGGIHQTMMMLAALRDALPPEPEEIDERLLTTRMVFSPQWSPHVGAFLEQTFSVEPVFQTEQLSGYGHDICFTPAGHMAVTIHDDGNVLLFSQAGQLLMESKKVGVKLLEPCGIIYHPGEDALVIAENMTGQITLLNPNTLKLIRSQTMSCITKPIGLSMMNNNETIVVTQAICTDDTKMGVFTTIGECLTLWTTYGDDNKKLARPVHTFVDSLDRVWIPGVDGDQVSIIAFDVNGQVLHNISTPRWPLGLAEYDGEILVAVSHGGVPGYPDYPGEVIACNVDAGSYRTILHWSHTEQGGLGRIISLTVQDNKLAVLGTKGLKMYELTQPDPLPTINIDCVNGDDISVNGGEDRLEWIHLSSADSASSIEHRSASRAGSVIGDYLPREQPKLGSAGSLDSLNDSPDSGFDRTMFIDRKNDHAYLETK